MAASSASLSLKEYLKKYQSGEDDSKKSKKKKKEKPKPQSSAAGVLVVDEDYVWQKPVHVDDAEDEDDFVGEDTPQIEEDIEVKRMKRLEFLRSCKPYHGINEDGSGWVSIPHPKPLATNTDALGLSPQQKPDDSLNADLSLTRRQRRKRFDSPSPEEANLVGEDPSPPRQQRRLLDSPYPEPLPKVFGGVADDLSPPRSWQRAEDHSPPPRAQRRMREVEVGPASPRADLSPPRRARKGLRPIQARGSPSSDLSPPRRTSKESQDDLSPPRRARKQSIELAEGRNSSDPEPSPTRRKEPSLSKTDRKGGLLSAKEMKEEIGKKKKEEKSRFALMDPSLTGRGVEAVHRDKEGKRISKEDLIKSNEIKKEERPLEWGKGLAQKREAEKTLKEMELEMERPFARSRDDPELDKMLKDRIRWGDPMAHVVKWKSLEPILEDLGENEKMKESGFIIPQTIPSHSWLKRGLDLPLNRYGIRPGRHWDGVDRSNGYEKQLFKRQNEKRATESEAYLWSVSDM